MKPSCLEKAKQICTSERFAPLMQFIKFGMVGVVNTLITYVTENVGYYWLFATAQFEGLRALLPAAGLSAGAEQIRVVVVTLLGFVLSVSNAYYWNNRFVFTSGEHRSIWQHAGAFLRTVLCYGVTGLLLSPVIKLLLGSLGVPFWLASFSTLVVTIPLNFVLNKFWAFK